MARLLAGGTSGELVYSVSTGGSVLARTGLAVTMYAAATGGTLADILTEAGGAVAGSVLTTDSNGLLPVFQLPDGVDTVYALPAGASVRVAVRAETDARLDDLPATFAVRAPDWVTARAYVVGELVSNAGTLYRTTTAHTSGGAFDAAKFTAIGGGGGSLTVQDENGNVGTSITQIDFQGAGVTATAGAGEIVVTIPGGASNVQSGTIAGQIPVWDTVDGRYEPTTPVDATAADVSFAPAGNIAATNVQAAIVELDTEKSGTGHTHAATGITVQDENVNVGTGVSQLDFQGAGVTAAAGVGGEVIVTITGGGASTLTVQDEGVALATDATTLNFVGAGVTAAGTAAVKTITIPGGSGVAGRVVMLGDSRTLTNMAVAESDVLGWPFRNRINLAGVAEVRMHTAIGGGVGPAGCKLYLQYTTDITTVNPAGWTNVASLETSIGAGLSFSIQVSAWIALPSAAAVEAIWRVMGSGGDAAADPVVGMIFLEYR